MNDRQIKKDVNQSKEEQKRQYELRMKKQRRRETITVLAILSSVFIVALLLALLKGGERMVQNFTGGSLAQAREVYENTRSALIGMGFISGVIVIVFLIQTIKDRRNRKRNEMERQPFIDYDRLEMARIRVEKARMDAKKSLRGDSRSLRIKALEQEDKEYLLGNKNRIPEGMSEEEYRRLRQEEYERYMRMDFDEEEDDREFNETYGDELSDENDYQSIGGSLRRFILDHGLMIGITAGVLILAVLAFVVL